MVEVSKEFWVDRDAFDVINNDSYENIVISRKKSTSKLYKITISYDIEREITIKESQLSDILESSGLTTLIQDSLKRKLFGGGENE